MKRTLPLFLAIACSGALVAQCTSSVPANAVVISSSTAGVHSQSNTNFWVCNTAFQQIFTGTNNNFWFEPQAFFNSVNGSNNIIRYKGTAPMGVFGSNNTIYATSASAISNQGSGNVINACGANGVIYNYNSAPPGCSTVGVDEVSAPRLSVVYDRSTEMLLVQDPNGTLREVRVYDITGRTVTSQAADQRTAFSVATLPAGQYIVQLVTADGVAAHRIAK